MVTVIIDTSEREFGDRVSATLVNNGIEVFRERLDVGDYLVGKYIIERKTVGDFISSIEEGRLWEQMKSLKDVIEDDFHPIIIIIGVLPSINYEIGISQIQTALFHKSKYKARKFRYRFPTPKKVIGGLVGTVPWKIPIYNIPDSDTFIEFITQLAYKQENKNIFQRPTKKQHYTLDDIRSDILCSIPNIGRVKAKKILEKYGSIENFINESEEEIIKDKTLKVNKKIYDNIQSAFKGGGVNG